MTIYYETSDEMLDELMALQSNPSVCILDYGYSVEAGGLWEIVIEVRDAN